MHYLTILLVALFLGTTALVVGSLLNREAGQSIKDVFDKSVACGTAYFLVMGGQIAAAAYLGLFSA